MINSIDTIMKTKELLEDLFSKFGTVLKADKRVYLLRKVEESETSHSFGRYLENDISIAHVIGNQAKRDLY